jgi:hypothetical protein
MQEKVNLSKNKIKKGYYLNLQKLYRNRGDNMNVIAKRLREASLDLPIEYLNEATRKFINTHSHEIKEIIKKLINEHDELKNKPSDEIARSKLVIDYLNDYVLENELDYIDVLSDILQKNGIQDAESEAKDSLYSDGVPFFSNSDLITKLVKELKGQ